MRSKLAWRKPRYFDADFVKAKLLDLNDPRRLEYRAHWISVLNLARRFDAELHRRLLGYPADLPDRATLKPPGGNIRPNGIVESHFARRKRDELPETY